MAKTTTKKPTVKGAVRLEVTEISVGVSTRINIGNYESVELRADLTVISGEDYDTTHAQAVEVVNAMLNRQVASCPYLQKSNLKR